MANPPRPARQIDARRGWLGVVGLIVIVAFIVAVGSGSNAGSGRAPSHFTVSAAAVTSLTTDVIDNASGSPGLQGTPHVSCTGEALCRITYAVREPSGRNTDAQLIRPTAQIWKGLFEDRHFQGGTIAVIGPLVSATGAASSGTLFTLSCTQTAAARIDWDRIDGHGLRTLCAYVKLVHGL